MTQHPGPVPTPGREPVTTAFSNLSLTAASPHGAGSTPSQPAQAFDPTAFSDDFYRRPFFPQGQNPFGNLKEIADTRPRRTGYEAADWYPPFQVAESWYLRMCVANNFAVEYAAQGLRRDKDDVEREIAYFSLEWTREEDDVLRGLTVEEGSDMDEIKRLVGNASRNPTKFRFADEIRERARLLEWESASGAARRRAAGPEHAAPASASNTSQDYNDFYSLYGNPAKSPQSYIHEGWEGTGETAASPGSFLPGEASGGSGLQPIPSTSLGGGSQTTQTGTQGPARRPGGRSHIYTLEEDLYIKHAFVDGITYDQMAQTKFRGTSVTASAVRQHAWYIGASWGKKDDAMLERLVLGYLDRGVPIDWVELSAKYDPPRDARVVEKRWEEKFASRYPRARVPR